MATGEQIAELRRKTSEPDETTYNDATLGQMIDGAGSVDEAASEVWQEKASMYSELVDISEAGSSRKNSQLMQNALEMARYYGSASSEELVQSAPRTSPIRRAES